VFLWIARKLSGMSSAIDNTISFLEKRDGIDKVRATLAGNEPYVS
jgi:hypothetical protein